MLPHLGELCGRISKQDVRILSHQKITSFIVIVVKLLNIPGSKKKYTRLMSHKMATLSILGI